MWMGSSEDEREADADDGQRLGEGEAQDGDALEDAARLRLACHTVDVGGEDQADTHTRADGREAVAHHVQVAFHCSSGSFPWVLRSGVPSCRQSSSCRCRGQCSSASAPAMYRADSSTKTYACRTWTKASKKVRTIEKANGTTDRNARAPPFSTRRYSPPSTVSSSTRCPAHMLRVRRRVSVIGRMMTVDRNSSGASST